MKRVPSKKTILAACIALLAFLSGYVLNGPSSSPEAPAPEVSSTAGHESHADHKPAGNESADVLWTCSMHPQIKLQEFGQCPICFMDLIPLQGEASGDKTSLRQISLSPEARQLAGIVVAKVQRHNVAVEKRLAGKVAYDETRVRTITAWTEGRIQEMHVDFTGSTVRKGEPMVSIYSPELVSAQAELLQARKTLEDLRDTELNLVQESAARTVRAAKEKLRRLGLSAAQIGAIIKRGKPLEYINVPAPLGGVVLAKEVKEGQYVKTGTPLYAVADLSRVWVVLEAYESDLPWLEQGQKVGFRTKALPGQVFEGKVVFIDPLVDETTRTVRIRLSVSNAEGKLKPGMLVQAVQQASPQPANAEHPPLVIPASAPLRTGKRAVVYVADAKNPGQYEGREIILGPRAGDQYIVKHGLQAGELVVTQGNFKIDSAVQIQAGPSMMNPPGAVLGATKQDLPPLFTSQLRLLHAAFNRLQNTVQTNDLEATHLAFGRFHTALRQIDATGLEDVASLKWNEFAILLGNDAILGAEAPDTGRLQTLFTAMRRHHNQLHRVFALSFESPHPVPEEFERRLRRVYAHYEDLAAALANDDYQTAKEAAVSLEAAFAPLRGLDLPGSAQQAWKQAHTDIGNGLKHMRTAKDIESLRTGFAPVSNGLSTAYLELAAQAPGPLYEAFCPMAFDFQGATWLQSDQDIRNPYFGAAMLNCGEIQQHLQH